MQPQKRREPKSTGLNPLVVKESERAALGLAINEKGEPSQRLVTELEEGDFFYEDTRAVFCAIRSICDEGVDCNVVTVAARSGVRREDVSDYCSGADSLSPSDIPGLVQEIRRASSLRKLSKVIAEAQGLISAGKQTSEDILQVLEQGLYTGNRDGKDAEDAYKVTERVLGEFLNRTTSGGGVEVSTGLRDVDTSIIGLRPAKMIVVGARPGMGKTAFAGTLTDAVLKQGLGVLTFSMEMTSDELVERHVAALSQVNARKILTGKDMTREEIGRVLGSQPQMQQHRWFIDDTTYSITGMRRRAKMVSSRLVRNGSRLGLIVVDYIQLANGDDRDGREKSVADVSRGAKRMAKECGCAVLALSQLNRNCDARENKRPLLADLRESGSIEQDADCVIFLYRDSMYNRNAPEDEAEAIVAKQRNGKVGTIPLRYMGNLVRFMDATNVASNMPEDQYGQ